MMYKRKLISFVLVLSMLLIPISNTFAEEMKIYDDIPEYFEYRGKIENISINMNELTDKKSGSMLVKNISDVGEDKLSVGLGEDVLIVDNKTGNKLDIEDIKKSDKVRVFYNKNTPIAESYPAQLYPDFVVVEKVKDGMEVKLDRFDDNMISSDGKIQVILSKNTEITDLKGNKVLKEELKNEDLIVFYNKSTDSIPGKVDAIKIIKFENRILDEFVPKFTRLDGIIKDIEEGKIIVRTGDIDIQIILNDDVFITSDLRMKETEKRYLKKDMEVSIYLNGNSAISKDLENDRYSLLPEVLILRENKKPIETNLDVFNNKLLSRDKTMKLNISKDTKIRDIENKSVEEKEIKNSNLLVFYSESTDSIPAIVNPKRIIYLGKDEDMTLPNIDILEEFDMIKINGKDVDLSVPIIDGDKCIMIPLREVAEKLGYDIKWNQLDFSVELIKGAQWTKLKIDENKYIYGKMDIFELEKGPELNNGKTYVPLSFIYEVLQIKDINISESGILTIN